jgi:hypothetical protein
MFLRASLVLALGLLFISCLSGAQGLDYAIEWYTGNPAFAGTDPINSCFTGGAQNRTYFCTTINLFDTVFWFIPAAASVDYVSYVRATDSTFNYTVQNFKFTALPDFFSGDANAANELTANQYFSYQFVDSGTFYFINPNESTVMLGAITILNQTSIDRQSGSSTFDDNVSTFDDVLSIIVLVLLSISIGGALLTLFTFLIFPKIRTYPIKLIMYLCLVIIIGNLWFILCFEPEFRDDSGLCFITGMIVHGFYVANFCWTFCIAFNFYQMIVRRNRESESLEKWYHLFSWGIPGLCVLCTTCVLDYGDTGGACYITSALYIFLFFFIPGLTIISLNAILFFFVIREIHETLASAPKTDKKDKKKEIRVYISIFISIGLSWIFGFFMVLFPERIVQLIFLTLFSLTTPAQGALIFIFYCLNYKVLGKYAGLIGYVIPYFKRWENLESRGTTSSGRTASSSRSSRAGRSYRSSRSSASASADTADSSADTSSRASSRAMDDDEDFGQAEENAGGINFGDDDL